MSLDFYSRLFCFIKIFSIINRSIGGDYTVQIIEVNKKLQKDKDIFYMDMVNPNEMCSYMITWRSSKQFNETCYLTGVKPLKVISSKNLEESSCSVMRYLKRKGYTRTAILLNVVADNKSYHDLVISVYKNNDDDVLGTCHSSKATARALGFRMKPHIEL